MGGNKNLVPMLLYLLLFWAGWLLVTRAVAPLLAGFFHAGAQALVIGLTGTATAVLATWLARRKDRSYIPRNEAVLRAAVLLHFLKGFLAGAFLLALIVLSLVAIGGMRLESAGWQPEPELIVFYAGIIPLALMEEIAFRGYPFEALQQRAGLGTAQFVTAVCFALYHISPHYSLQQAFAGPFVWALLFGLAAAWSRGLAVPTGMHAALNLGQVLLGMKGKTGALFQPVFRNAPDAVKSNHTGLAWQAILLAAGILLTWYSIRRKKTVDG
ncbi:CPBP family intramembrane glutamic endopeptidase [Sediminibacterium soli]|uniref:CPBP family intramembrane glutamic endopeptidase n=1 Tax=Sediminibacterium soli TaxID=2698829 RepID=UPI00137A59D8|nr:type II CAAX endopeptidase family protein [Sediminibacterium soli]NCI46325.1 CPBP family intramembrane metalloprotease [Sediminibacterium soli]